MHLEWHQGVIISFACNNSASIKELGIAKNVCFAPSVTILNPAKSYPPSPIFIAPKFLSATCPSIHISSQCIIIFSHQFIISRASGTENSLLKSSNPLPPLPSIPRLKRIPLRNTPRLNTNHLLPPILGSKIRHRLRLCIPWIPDHDIAQHIARDLIARLVLFCDDDGLGGIGGVGAVDFGGDGDDVVGGLDGSATGGFVFVGGGFEAGDGDGGDVLSFYH